MTALPAVLLAGAPGTGKSTLSHHVARRLGAAVISQDVATGPLVDVVAGLSGVADLDDPRLAGLTRAARYRVVLDLAADNLAAGIPVVLVAPFTTERADPAAWAAARDQLITAGGQPLLVWLSLDPAERLRRLRIRGAARDAAKLADEGTLLAAECPPAVEHLALDASHPPDELSRIVIDAVGWRR